MEQLKQDLNEKCESCYLYSEEIEKLQLYVKETTTLQLEKELLLVSYHTYLISRINFQIKNYIFLLYCRKRYKKWNN